MEGVNENSHSFHFLPSTLWMCVLMVSRGLLQLQASHTDPTASSKEEEGHLLLLPWVSFYEEGDHSQKPPCRLLIGQDNITCPIPNQSLGDCVREVRLCEGSENSHNWLRPILTPSEAGEGDGHCPRAPG